MTLRTLSITEAVAETGISRDTLYLLCETGQVQANRATARGRWRVSASSLEAWVHRQAAPRPVIVDRDEEAEFRRRFPEVQDDPLFT